MTTTRIIILATLIMLALYDAWACTSGGVDASISQFIVNLVNVSPVSYGVACVLLGHFGFPMVAKFRSGDKK